MIPPPCSLEPRQRQPQLIAAVAAPRAEHVAGQASRMQAHRNGLGEDPACRRSPRSACRRSRRERPRSGREPPLSGHGSPRRSQRLDRSPPEPRTASAADGHERRIARAARRDRHRRRARPAAAARAWQARSAAAAVRRPDDIEVAGDLRIRGEREDAPGRRDRRARAQRAGRPRARARGRDAP